VDVDGQHRDRRVFAAYLPRSARSNLIARELKDPASSRRPPCAGRSQSSTRSFADVARARHGARPVGEPIPGINALSAARLRPQRAHCAGRDRIGPAGSFEPAVGWAAGAQRCGKCAAGVSQRLGYLGQSCNSGRTRSRSRRLPNRINSSDPKRQPATRSTGPSLGRCHDAPGLAERALRSAGGSTFTSALTPTEALDVVREALARRVGRRRCRRTRPPPRKKPAPSFCVEVFGRVMWNLVVPARAPGPQHQLLRSASGTR